MYKDLSPETLEAISIIAKALGASVTDMHITRPMICDHCQDDEKEAFPYYATDKNGREWEHLCNTCFDLLECELDGYWDE